MARTVMCRKYQKQMPGLEQAPLPGSKGQDLFENVSKQAWGEWLEHQTRLINEKQLNMLDLGDRNYLSEQMQKFFSGGDMDQVEGYVPPSE